MQVVIEIPEKDIQKHGQGMITVHIDFHTGELCRCTYPCMVLPKGHGRLIDERFLKENMSKWLRPTGNPDETEMVSIDDIAISVITELEEQPTIIPADKEG